MANNRKTAFEMKKNLSFCFALFTMMWTIAVWGSNGTPGVVVTKTMELPRDFDVNKLAEGIAKSFEGYIEKNNLNEYKAPIPQNKVYRNFPSLDEQLWSSTSNNSMILDGNSSLPAAPVNGDFIEDVILELGSGDYSDDVKQARLIIQKAIEAGEFLQGLSGGNVVTLPRALINSKKFGNVTVTVVLADIKLYPEFSKVTMYAELLIPQRNRGKPVRLTFGGFADFSYSGGIAGQAVLGLMADCSFEMPGSNRKVAVKLHKYVLPAGVNPQIGIIPDSLISLTSGTFILFDCNGFRSMGLKAELFFSRSWMLPVTVSATGEYLIDQNDQNLVNAKFEVYVDDWNNIFVGNISIDTFVVTKWQKMTFAVGKANVDLSDFRNPTGMQFPEGYLNPPPGNLWRGVYVDYIEITLPQPFKKACQGYTNPPPAGSQLQTCRIEIEVNKLLIDETGISGYFEAGGQAPLAAGGIMDKAWSWSLDSIEIQLLQSDIVGFEFGGVIVVPVQKEATPLKFTGGATFIPQPDGPNEETYFFTAILGSTIKFPFWKAVNVTLLPGTSLNVTVENDEFVPTANLTGTMVLGDPEDNLPQNGGAGSSFKAPGVEFRYLIVTSRAPYLDLGAGGYVALIAPGATFKNFPIGISQLSFAKDGDTGAKLGACLTLNLMGEGDGGLSAEGCFNVLGKLVVNANGGHRWVYDGIEFTGATVELDFPPVYAYGSLNIFENDSIYGNGFSALLHAEIELSNSGLVVDVGAVFGKKDGYRYWMFDGYAQITTPPPAPGIPLPPSPLFLNGFGGGMFWHMKPVAALPLGQSQPIPGVVSDPSGIIYHPDQGTGLGLKFALGLTTSAGLLTGKLTCIVRFSPSFSLQNIMFWGEVEYVVPTDAGAISELVDFQEKINDVIKPVSEIIEDNDESTADPPPNTIIGRIGISLDFVNWSFHAFAEAKINFPDAGVKGYGAVDIWVDPSEGEWHLFIGGYQDGSVEVPEFFNPEASIALFPVSVTLTLLGTNLEANLYFLTGTGIPGPPPMHPEAAAYFEEPVPEQGNRPGLNACGRSPASGTGIAFGASMLFKFDKKIKKKILFTNVTILDVKVNGGVGFDIALLKYHASTSCSNGVSPHGLNGFRATGRVWAFVNASGKVLFIPIPPIGVGLKFEADIPKPSYFDCVVVINFIKKWRFGIELGDKCGTPCSGL